MNFRTRLKQLRMEKQLNQTDLGSALNLATSTISMYENGKREPDFETLETIADYFNVDIDYLLGKTDKITRIEFDDYSDVKNLIHPSAYRIPIVGKICAGDGCFVIEEKMGYFTIDHTIKADFALVVKGDSMIDIDINDGDIVLIKKVFDYYDGKIYAIRLIDENEATIKRCYFEEDKVIMQPCNPEFKPMIADCKNVSVVGECVGVYHAL
ncbi:hypothetical protein HMPREF1635_01955 [Clostridiales bacterium S5-A14a]|nr:hypothetical protein HMPREF1635_01955 [Clostridiales bacterium S5-A14a]